MQHNARTRKTMCNTSWSCREGRLAGSVNDIINSVELELEIAKKLIKQKMSASSKSGKNNPMYGKKHSVESKEKMKQLKLKRKK
jgi:hypothetical protein